MYDVRHTAENDPILNDNRLCNLDGPFLRGGRAHRHGDEKQDGEKGGTESHGSTPER